MKLTPEKWEKKMQKFRRSSTLRIQGISLLIQTDDKVIPAADDYEMEEMSAYTDFWGRRNTGGKPVILFFIMEL